MTGLPGLYLNWLVLLTCSSPTHPLRVIALDTCCRRKDLTNLCWSSLVHAREHNRSGVSNHETKSILSSLYRDSSWRAPLVLGRKDWERAERTKHVLYPNLGEVGRNCSQCDLRCCKIKNMRSITWLSHDLSHCACDLRCMVGAMTVTPVIVSAVSFFAFVLALASDSICVGVHAVDLI